MTTAPYGSWRSPITLDRLVEGVVGLSFPIATPQSVLWSELRPSEGARVAVVEMDARAVTREVFGAGWSARTSVHEYGGLCVAVAGDSVFFSNARDQRLYRVVPGADPVAITPEPEVPRGLRYAAPVVTPDGRWLVCVRETHDAPDVPASVVNDLVVVDASGGAAPQVIVAGHDFFSHPALSHDGRRLAWVSWDHPNMPWDGTELFEATIDLDAADGPRLGTVRLVAGGPGESVVQPKYTKSGALVFCSDRSGWWNLYRAGDAGGGARGAAVALAPMEADLGAPDWVFGTSSYAVLEDDLIVGTWSADGVGHLGTLSPGERVFREVESSFTDFAQLRAAPDGRSLVAVAGSATLPQSIVTVVPEGAGVHIETLRSARPTVVTRSYVSVPEHVTFGSKTGREAHALFYAPTNPDFSADASERPPLIVKIHGGPTSSAQVLLDYEVQFWTSRGFAVVDVNYGGSTGYGRAYRELLKGAWGVVDLEDCVSAAEHLVESGRVDGDRLLIHGGSAGGYTTMCAVTFTDVFAAGASYYGVADARVLAAETHKFESHYTDSLFGPWPDTEPLYLERSPVAHSEMLRTPLIVFQGLEDKVVPPNQAEIMVDALARNGVPHAYVTYEGEGHGFKMAANRRRTAEAELSFYAQILGFTPADDLVPVMITEGS